MRFTLDNVRRYVHVLHLRQREGPVWQLTYLYDDMTVETLEPERRAIMFSRDSDKGSR